MPGKPGLRAAKARAYVLLALVFVLAAIYQTIFTFDLVTDLRMQYAARPVELGPPWPTVIEAYEEARKAGLRVGDRVVSIEGKVPRGLSDLLVPVREKAPGESIEIAVLRNGNIEPFGLTLGSYRSNARPFILLFALVAWILTPAVSLAVGFWVTAVRPLDRRAWLVLGVLLGISQFVSFSNVDVQSWPTLFRIPSLLYRNVSLQALPVCMMLFGLYFPARWRYDRSYPWAKWILLLPLLVGGCGAILREITRSEFYNLSSAFGQLIIPTRWSTLLWTGAISVFFGSIAEKYHNPELDSDDRRRLRLLYWGCACAMTPLLGMLLWGAITRQALASGLPLAWAFMMLFLFPLTMAYVIVVQRAMDVRMVVRQGVQYVLARRGMLFLQVLISAATVYAAASLAVDNQVNRTNRVLLLAAGIAAIFLIRLVADRLRRWLDRRFFREAYDAERILGELSEEVRTIVETRPLLETVAQRISQSLHVERMAMFLRGGDGLYTPSLAVGYQSTPDASFTPQAEIVSDLRHCREIKVFDWKNARISDGERASLAGLDSQLLLPLCVKEDLLGFISLGPKRSEQPYSAADVRLLRTVAAQTGLALENSRLAAAIAMEVAQRELMNREIEIAREVQQRLFPQTLPAIPGLDYAGYCRPARGVGGDYYDFLALPDGRFGFAVADISGKGIPAALLMASLQAFVRGQTQAKPSEIAALMANFNCLIYDASPPNRYATFFYAQYEPGTRTLTYVNGGHNPPLLLRGAELLKLETGGPVVGLFRAASYEQAEVRLEKDDLLLMFTDGISEAMNGADEEWGEDALVQAARSCNGASAAGMLPLLMSAADEFAAGAPQHDDMTLVVVRVLDSAT